MKKIVQIIGIVMCLIPLVGFGLCGVMGVGAGITQGGALDGRLFFIFLGLIGVAISIAFGFVIRMLFKNISSTPSDDNSHAS